MTLLITDFTYYDFTYNQFYLYMTLLITLDHKHICNVEFINFINYVIILNVIIGIVTMSNVIIRNVIISIVVMFFFESLWIGLAYNNLSKFNLKFLYKGARIKKLSMAEIYGFP